MILKVDVNLPQNTEELIEKVTETAARILVHKLNSKEIEQLISLLQDEEFNINL